MPMPRAVARLNKRYTNRFIEPVVRRFPGFAIVAHAGRRTGRNYRTSLVAFDCDGALLVALTYGPSADWVQNVLVNGGAVSRHDVEHIIEAASIVGRDVAWPYLPHAVRGALRCLRVHDFMLLDLDLSIFTLRTS